MVLRLTVLALVIGLAIVVRLLWTADASPEIAADLALAQVADSDSAAASMRTYSQVAWRVDGLLTLGVLAAGVLLFLPQLRSLLRALASRRRGAAALAPAALLIGSLGLSGCKPFDEPEYVEIQTNETAFVIPLEGDLTKQVAFESAAKLAEHKVAAKRIQIPHRWNQTGRMNWSGEWIDMVRVVKVSRTPVTREWSAEERLGTSRRDEGLWAESSDSVGFSTGFSCTSFVSEVDTALFLYSYNGQTLAEIMDTEVRARVQSNMAEFAAEYPMDQLRDQKGEMLASIRQDVVPYFKAKGITISTLGQFGGFAYENPKIQEAIDNVFVSQQEKQVAKAMLEAQADKNRRLEMEGQGIAAKLREEAKGRKDAAIVEAEGKKEALLMVAEATRQANQDPLFLEIKKLEVAQQQIEQWDGRYPTYLMSTGGGGNQSLLLNVPSRTAN